MGYSETWWSVQCRGCWAYVYFPDTALSDPKVRALPCPRCF